MRTKEFLGRFDHGQIVKAIEQAESKTSGQIRVYIQRGELKEGAILAAQRYFQKLRMQKTRKRNAVLIFIAPRAQKFAVIGDEGIHQKCGEEFWKGLVEAMRRHFQKNEFSEALVEAIEEAGILLTRHFPKTTESVNELPNEVIEE